MNTITLSWPTWASTAYKKSFNAKEPAKNHFTPKHFTRTYAAVASKTTENKTSDKQQPQQQPAPKQHTMTSVPSTAPTGPVSTEPLTLTPQSDTKKKTNLITPTKANEATNHKHKTTFVKETEQKFLDISRELMEIRTGRQAMVTRVIQIERKSDKLSAQMQELMKNTSKIIAKLHNPEESVPPVTHAPPKQQQGDDDVKYLMDPDLKKFWKKVENILGDAFHSFGTEIASKLTSIEQCINSRLNDVVWATNSQEESDSDIEMDDDDDDDELKIIESNDKQGSRADSATPLTSVTATGQSLLKKQKGDQGSDGK